MTCHDLHVVGLRSHQFDIYLNVSSCLILASPIFLLFEEGSRFSSVEVPDGSAEVAEADVRAGGGSGVAVPLLLSLPEPFMSDTPLVD